MKRKYIIKRNGKVVGEANSREDLYSKMCALSDMTTNRFFVTDRDVVHQFSPSTLKEIVNKYYSFAAYIGLRCYEVEQVRKRLFNLI